MLIKVHTKKDLDYEQYSTLLLSTASEYDSKLVGTKGKRQAHDTMNYDDDDYYESSHDDDPFDLDTPVDTIQAFTSKFTPRKGPSNFNDRVCMPKDKWFGLDQNTQELWDQIDDKYKSIILGFTKPTASPPPLVNHLAKHLLQTLTIISTFMRCLLMTSYRLMFMKSHLKIHQMTFLRRTLL
jgi:hypothetical protein